jgi:hypothetical protein
MLAAALATRMGAQTLPPAEDSAEKTTITRLVLY